MLEILALERDQALVAAGVRTLVDRHGEMAAAEQVAGAVLACRHRRGDALLVETGASANVPGGAEIDDQHPHRSVGLGLQDEAAFELEHGSEHYGQNDGLAQ